MAYITSRLVETFHRAGSTGAAGSVTVSHASVIFNYGVVGELFLWTGALANPRVLVAGNPIRVAAGAMDINFPAGSAGIQDSAIKAAWDALIADKASLTMLLGTAAMGAAGKTNEVTDANYARQVVELTTGLGLAPTA